MEVSRPQAASVARTAVIALTAFLTVVALFATQAILPSLTRAYGVTPAAMSLAVNASTFGMAAASLATAFLAHRIDRRRGVIGSLALLAMPTLLLASAPNLATFAALRVAQGLFMASAFTLTLAYLGERFFGAQAAGAFAAYITGNVASNLFGRLMSAAIADHLGVAACFVVFAALNIAGAILVAASMRGAPRPAPEGRGPLRSGILEQVRRPGLAPAFAIGFCILFAFIGIFTYVNFVLVASPLALGMMGLGFTYFVFLPSIPTTLLAGHVVRRIGARCAAWLGLGAAGLGLPLLMLPSLPAVLAGMALAAIGTFFAQAVATGFVGRAAPDRGIASGIYLSCYFSGGLVGTAALGQAFDRFGWPGCLVGVALSLGAAAVLAATLRD